MQLKHPTLAAGIIGLLAITMTGSASAAPRADSGVAAATAPVQVAHHQKRKDRASTAQSRKPAVRGYRYRTRDFRSRNHNRFHHAFPASKRFRTNSP